MKRVLCTVVSAVVACIFAAPVTRQEAHVAASAFVSSDPVGSAVLGGRTVDEVRERDGLWVAALAPHGHIILSGSDRIDPIVAFSEKDFVEPPPESPALVALEAAAAASLMKESEMSGERHQRWTKLLGGGSTRKLLRAAAVENPSAVIVPPFMLDHFDQLQPYNDYAPVYEADTNNLNVYRGRCPCGCVATAAAQVFSHFKWPARIDQSFYCEHEFMKGSGGPASTYPIRFDGHVPMEWNDLLHEYDWYNYTAWSYDLRGYTPETVRYPIARLILLCDVMAKMQFAEWGSGAIFEDVVDNASEWYTRGRLVSLTEESATVKSAIQAGIPCHVELQSVQGGHQVVAHGWAEDATTQYIYINFGWGGANDGYYNINEDFDVYSEKQVYVGHYPRPRAQVDPLSKVINCGDPVTISWHIPDFYTNTVTGFWIDRQQIGVGDPADFLDDFSSTMGACSGDGVYINWDPREEDSQNIVLYTESASSGKFEFHELFTLTSASVLTMNVAGYYALSATLEVQAKFDGGEWETIASAYIEEGGYDLSWKQVRVYLGDRGGSTARFRLVKGYTNEAYYPNGYVVVDDFKLTSVIQAPTSSTLYLGSQYREYSFDDKEGNNYGISSGAQYAYYVTPLFGNNPGEASSPVMTTIAGERRRPLPGVESFSTQTLSFSANDTSGVWSYSGTTGYNNSVKDVWNASVSAVIHGALTANSTLEFVWSANCLYGSEAYDMFSVMFKCSDGTQYDIWSRKNTRTTSTIHENISLSAYAGKKGILVISYEHSGSNYTSSGYGGTIYSPRITNVSVPAAPAVAWVTETVTAHDVPEIVSVSPLDEGLYSECGTNTTAFTVTCSESVTGLRAFPSHLAVVSDNDISITPNGNGRFTLAVTPSGLTEDNYRTRIILTLEATNANGTAVYKDLSLRFAPVETVPAVDVVVRSDAGEEQTVTIPHSWFVENNLAAEGAEASAFENAAQADSDGDGISNWCEYVCATDPSDPDEKLTCSVTVENGLGKVSYSPRQVRQGYRSVLKGTDNLGSGQWTVVTTETSQLHFFKVVIEPAD